MRQDRYAHKVEITKKQLTNTLLLSLAMLIGFLLNHYELLNWNTELIHLLLALIHGLLLVLYL